MCRPKSRPQEDPKPNPNRPPFLQRSAHALKQVPQPQLQPQLGMGAGLGVRAPVAGPQLTTGHTMGPREGLGQSLSTESPFGWHQQFSGPKPHAPPHITAKHCPATPIALSRPAIDLACYHTWVCGGVWWFVGVCWVPLAFPGQKGLLPKSLVWGLVVFVLACVFSPAVRKQQKPGFNRLSVLSPRTPQFSRLIVQLA